MTREDHLMYILTLTIPVGPIPKTRPKNRGFVRETLQIIKTKPLSFVDMKERIKKWKAYYGIAARSGITVTKLS